MYVGPFLITTYVCISCMHVVRALRSGSREREREVREFTGLPRKVNSLSPLQGRTRVAKADEHNFFILITE